MVKLDKQFIDTSLKKDPDPEVWITEWKDFCFRLDYISSSISENQFIIHALNTSSIFLTGGNYCSYCRKPVHVRQNHFKLKKRYNHNQAGNNNNGNFPRNFTMCFSYASLFKFLVKLSASLSFVLTKQC
jgi:hypothetical protein